MDALEKALRGISSWTPIILFTAALVIYESNLGLRLALGPDHVWIHNLTLACVVTGPIVMAACPFQSTETRTAWWTHYAVLGYALLGAVGPVMLLFAVYGALGPEVAAQGPSAQLVVNLQRPAAGLTCEAIGLFALGVPVAAWIATVSERRASATTAPPK